MRPDLIQDLSKKEETYWWNVSRRQMVLSLLRSLGRLQKVHRGWGVDIGCGGGYTAKTLEPYYRIVGIDRSDDFLQLSRNRGLEHLLQVDLSASSFPFKSESFQLVLALDLLEHLEDDVHALKECERILGDEGVLIVNVPAYMSLWSPWDEALGHKRRYSARTFLEKASQTRLEIRKISYLFFFLFPLAACIRKIKKCRQRDAANYSTDFMPIPGWINSGLVRIGQLEQLLITKLGLRLPFGLSLISVMTKKPQ